MPVGLGRWPWWGCMMKKLLQVWRMVDVALRDLLCFLARMDVTVVGCFVLIVS